MTDERRAEIWLDDVARGTFPLNHFMYCYVHPENVNVLLLGVRLTAAFDTATIRFDCPMLRRTWQGDLHGTDFRNDIASEIQRELGIKRDEERETYKLCPYSLVLSGTQFITCHANDMKLDLSTAYWLPPVRNNWVRELRAA